MTVRAGLRHGKQLRLGHPVKRMPALAARRAAGLSSAVEGMVAVDLLRGAAVGVGLEVGLALGGTLGRLVERVVGRGHGGRGVGHLGPGLEVVIAGSVRGLGE
jgi:hypothetical protein